MAGASRRALRTAGALIATPAFVLALTAPALTGSAVARTAKAGSPVVRSALQQIGARPRLPRHSLIAGLAPAATRLHVTVALKPRNPAALAGYAEAVSNPASGAYQHFLTPAGFAQRFGATPAEVKVVDRALRSRGLTPGQLSAGALSIPLTATASQLERGLSISLLKLALPGRRMALAADTAPSIPAVAAGLVQSVIGLDTAVGPKPLLARLRGGSSRSGRGGSKHKRPHVVTAGPQPCAAAQATAEAQGAHTDDQIASAYGFSGLYSAGDQGAGTTVALYELEPVEASDIAAYQACYGTHTAVSYDRIDGGAGVGAGGGEAALDIENVIGLAPASNVLVYEGPNSNSSSPGSGPYDVFSAIVNQDRAQVVSVSWGECEHELGAADGRAEGNLFEQAAVQGQTIVAASGDSGSEDCDAGGTLPQTELAVDDPSSQPFVTGVGGTTLSSLGPRPTESVWNTGGGLVPLLQPGAAGGGISDLWPMPAGQRDAAASLHVLGAGVTGSACGQLGGYCREVPDVSADADPSTGYVIYWNGTGSESGSERGWQAIGGTSGAAPLWAALFALTDSSRACAGHPVGYAVPALYRAASSSYTSDFNDVRSGNNDFTGTNGGRFTAGPGYDEASGLGTPNGTPLAGNLCADSLHLTDPGSQSAAKHASISLRLRSADARATPIAFHASGLPPGLRLNGSTGRVTGRPTRTGRFHVTVVAQDPQQSTARESFTWSVGGAPRILGLTAGGFRTRHPTLSFTVKAGRGSPALRELEIAVPKGLRIVSAQGLRLTTSNRARVRFRAHVATGLLVVALHKALSQVSVTLAGPGLRSVSGRKPNARGASAPRLGVSVVDSGHGTSQLRAKLANGK
jgi:subtilase family serine protease